MRFFLTIMLSILMASTYIFFTDIKVDIGEELFLPAKESPGEEKISSDLSELSNKVFLPVKSVN